MTPLDELTLISLALKTLLGELRRLSRDLLATADARSHLLLRLRQLAERRDQLLLSL